MRKLFLFLILTGILIVPVLAQSTTEEKYKEEFNKLKVSSSYITLNDKGEIEYSILNYDPAYNYFIRVYSYRHISIIQEYQVKEPVGTISFKYPGLSFKIHINLQKWIPKEKEKDYCKSYPCLIGENLDIFTTSINEKVPESDLYTVYLRAWTKDQIKGASWQAMVTVDKEEKV